VDARSLQPARINIRIKIITRRMKVLKSENTNSNELFLL